MKSPRAWDPVGFRHKAAVYFERAFESDSDSDQFAFWCHLALEPLARAAVAHVHPALLAAQNNPGSLQYGLGVGEIDEAEIASITTAHVAQLCVRFVEGFGKAEQAALDHVRNRRNAELHTALPALADLPTGWLGQCFAIARVLLRHLDLELTDLLTADQSKLVERLIVEDADAVKKVVHKAIADASVRAAALRENEKKQRVEAAEERDGARFDVFGANAFAAVSSPARLALPRLLKPVPCPACATTVPLRGEVVSRSPARILDGELIEVQSAVPTLLVCPVCDLKLESIAELAVVGLGDPVSLKDHLDPIEEFDVDISDLRHEFLESMMEPDYQDE